MALVIELPPLKEQTERNLRRWAELLNDPDLARLPHRIETDRHGHILMGPPPAPFHGNRQSEVAFLLKTLLPEGRTLTECPVSTSDGVKASDVAWLVPERRGEIRSVCLTRSPEICVEVISPSNSRAEMDEKRALYFEAGAQEVWFCDEAGKMTFWSAETAAPLQASRVCPGFPVQLDLP